MNNPLRLSLDYEAFDATINEKLLSIVFSCLKDRFHDFHSSTKDWAAMEREFIFSKVLLPDGFFYMKRHGIASGSG